ncbi:MAG: hypothetical protein HYU36_00025 [Planctomycetes bacterium]|nr:hypothetical protein [Planctomycetota bacterium]
MSFSPLQKFGFGVLIVLVLGYLLGQGGLILLIPLLLVLALLILGAEFFRNPGARKHPLRVLGGRSEFLCDDCKWNYGNACVRPERPNARECPEYKPK